MLKNSLQEEKAKMGVSSGNPLAVHPLGSELDSLEGGVRVFGGVFRFLLGVCSGIGFGVQVFGFRAEGEGR